MRVLHCCDRAWPALLGVAALVLSSVGCSHAPDGPDASALTQPAASVSLRFEAVPNTGVDVAIVNGDPEAPYIIDAMGTGACLLDHDGDGFLDLFVVNGSTLELLRQGRGASSRLYRNRGDWTFEDVTEFAGVPGEGWGQGCAVGDVDGDGDPDLYLTALGPNLLYLNQGDGRFQRAPADFGAGDEAWSASAAFGDLDGDGVLDLYVTNYVDIDLEDLPRPHGGRRSYQKLIEVFAGPQGLVAAPDSLYRGRGDGTFEEVSEAWGAREREPRYGLGVLFLDADDDGLPDVYVANDSQPNFLFVNRGGGRLEERGLLSGVALSEDGRSQAGMGIAAGDEDGDGLEDLFVTNFSGDGNTLSRNIGRGFFQDVTAETGLAQASHAQLGWGAHLFDADLDGTTDLLLVNGHVYPQVSGVASATGHAQANQLFLQGSDGRFSELLSPAGGSGLALLGSSRGLACGDLDNDGDIDSVVVNVDGGVDLVRNESDPRAGWLAFDLKPARGGPEPFGARVVVREPSGRRQSRWMRTGASYLSSHDPRIFFGLGEVRSAEVSVRWPGGAEESFGRVEAGRFWTLREGAGEAEALQLPQRAPASSVLDGPMAELVSPMVGAPPETQLPAGLADRSPEEHLRLAGQARDAGRFGRAVAHARAAAEARPEDANAHSLLGGAAFASGRMALAGHHLREAARLAPEDADIHLRLAEFLVNERSLDEAQSVLEATLELRPDDGAALYLLGVALQESGDNERAALALSRAAERVPAPAKVRERQGLALLDSDRLDEAQGAFEEALIEEPGLLGARYGLEIIRARREGTGRTAETRQLERLSQLASDISHQRALVAAAPRDDYQRFRLAQLLAEAGRHGEARGELASVLNRQPRFMEALLAHAESSLALGDPALAARVLDRAGQLAPADGRVDLGRAHVELAGGHGARALELLRRAESRLPDSAEAQESLARLILEGAEGVPADATLAAAHARRARELGSGEVLLIARCLAGAGSSVELAAFVSDVAGRQDGVTRRELRNLAAATAGEAGR